MTRVCLQCRICRLWENRLTGPSASSNPKKLGNPRETSPHRQSLRYNRICLLSGDAMQRRICVTLVAAVVSVLWLLGPWATGQDVPQKKKAAPGQAKKKKAAQLDRKSVV